jgi:DNA invertase Pin-like site-specific DNA recombinase
MSTERQQYSLDNQHNVIAAYAERSGFTIVRTYTDGARSGLLLKGRDGLRQLLEDVVSRKAVFKAILVYDVSRWGRFQDADESAHYEFLCKSAGVPIHYCAEPFVNDGALQSTLMKALKRTMAGEYSRELGVKVLAGLKRLAALGVKQGGSAGYGLQRMLLSSDGKPKQLLSLGERKSIATERVTLVPGPVNEVETVREIYRMFVQEKHTVHEIARELNRRSVPYRNTLWHHYTILGILSHPKYTGCNVFGRTTHKLGMPCVRVPQTEWIRTPKAFVPIVTEDVYLEAQRLLASRTNCKSDEDVLDSLRKLLARHGRLSWQLIKEDAESPSPSTYRRRFGGLRRAYELIGYRDADFDRIDVRRSRHAIREEVLERIHGLFPTESRIVRQACRRRSFLRLKNGRIVAVLLAISVASKRRKIWQIEPVPQESRRVTLLVFLNETNSKTQEMRLFGRISHGNGRFRVREDDSWLERGTRLESIADFYKGLSRLSAS